MEFLLLLAIAGAVWAWVKKTNAERATALKARDVSRLAVRIAELENERESLRQQLRRLEPYAVIPNAEEVAARVLADANGEAAKLISGARQEAAKLISGARQEAAKLISGARQEAAKLVAEAREEREGGRRDLAAAKKKLAQEEVDKLAAAVKEVADARIQAGLMISAARKRAQDIAGEAHDAMKRAQEYAATADAMRGVIQGFGDAYIVPTYNLLDELADDFGHTEAGACLKRAREVTRSMVQTNRAGVCDYVEANRRDAAVRFVVDAFNGKVDSILARAKSDNHGTLEHEIRSAYALVNHNGKGFRDARITEEYLEARLEELRWAATAQALRDEEREEQRRIREQIREEERARREFERAMKEAAQEEEAIKRAMAKVQDQVAKANAEQRAAFEAKLQELQGKLVAAEERGRRALSMAQQTKVGHVYVISNVGSFGEQVFKIGMTRRLEPTDRVRELGDASVPFEFDVHAMIYSEDAPALERALHLHFLRSQVNKVNPRKEFFRLTLEEIKRHVEAQGIAAHWTMMALANDYRETLRIEQQIRDNPEVERAWTQHQVEAELAASVEEEAIEA